MDEDDRLKEGRRPPAAPPRTVATMGRWGGALLLGAVLSLVALIFYALFNLEVAAGPNSVHRIAFELVGCLILTGLIGIAWRALRADIRRAADTARSLREANLRLDAIVADCPAMIWLAGPDGGWTFVNRRLVDFTGREVHEHLDEGWLASVHPEDMEHAMRAYVKAFDLRTAFDNEFRLRRRDGVYRWFLNHGTPRLDVDGVLQGFAGMCVDITDRKRAQAAEQRSREAEQRLAVREGVLLRELDHRVRNNLMSLLSLVRLYERSGKAVAEVSEAVRGKITAMKEAHSLLSEGHESPVDVGTIVERLCRRVSVDDGDEMIEMTGPSIPVAPEQVGALAMVIEELLTNACKHGALQSPGGRVLVSWRIVERPADPAPDGSGEAAFGPFELRWEEMNRAGVAGATGADESTGIGTSLIKGLATSELRGGCSFDLRPSGLRFVLNVSPYRHADDQRPAELAAS